ncbi:MAG: DUF4852 domain-containing protein [Breznakibacter sp.]|nr:DUF4852 domain-containing protein [Breznakibacter sp.]
MNKVASFFLVVILGFTCYESDAQEFLEWRNSFDIFLKKTDLNKMNFVDEYMYCFNKTTFTQFREDEFEYHSKKKQEFDLLSKRLQQYSDSAGYYIVTSAKFGDFDFDKECFEFSPIDVNSVLTYRNIGNYPSNVNTSTKILLSFANGNSFQGLSMPVDRAKRFIEFRKSSNGDIDRRVLLKVYFTIDKDMVVDRVGDKYFTVNLKGNISQIMVFDSFGYNLKKGSGERIADVNKAK